MAWERSGTEVGSLDWTCPGMLGSHAKPADGSLGCTFPGMLGSHAKPEGDSTAWIPSVGVVDGISTDSPPPQLNARQRLTQLS